MSDVDDVTERFNGATVVVELQLGGEGPVRLIGSWKL